MFSLDPRTIIFVSMVIYFLLAGAMVLFSASLRHQRGPGYWAAGTCCCALFSFLLLFRDILPDWLTIIVGNQGLVISLCMVAHGLTLLLRQPSRLTLFLVVCAANLLGFIYFCYVTPSFSARVVVCSLSLAVVAARMARDLLPAGRETRDPTRLLVLFSLLALILFHGARVVAYSLHPGGSLLQGQAVNVVSLVFFPMNVVALCFSLIAFAASRFASEKTQANASLAQANQQLQDALANVKNLSGLLPICANCKKIRDDQGYWRQIETYLREHTDADFTHGICPSCAHELYGDRFKAKKVG